MTSYRRLEGGEVLDALNLVREVFFAEGNLGFPRRGAQSFLEFVSENGELLTWYGAFDGTLTGVLGRTEEFHIALFFVRKENRKQGIARHLFEMMREEARAAACARITVNAAESAVDVYEALGFETCGETETKDGITSVPMEYLLGRENLGRTVTVTVDRPYGSLHPHYPDTEYPCNYGYVEDVLAADGEFQDAYIIGVYEPVDSFTGVVTAIIYRRNDSESKWVVTKTADCDRREVIDTVGEVEQYFDTRILWLKNAEAQERTQK